MLSSFRDTKLYNKHFIMSKRSIKFIIEKGTKRPKAMDKRNSCFQIYSPEKFKIAPGEVKRIILNCSIHLPEDILSTFIVVPHLEKEGLKLIKHSETNCYTRIYLEFFNKTLHTTFKCAKNSKIALFMTLNEETAGLKTVFSSV